MSNLVKPIPTSIFIYFCFNDANLFIVNIWENIIIYFKSILSICVFIFFCNIAFTNDYISTAKQILGEYIVGGIKNKLLILLKVWI